MKADFYKNYMSAVFVAAALSFCSCSDDRTVSSGGLPYKSIRVTVDGETVTAERIDDKNLALRFDMGRGFLTCPDRRRAQRGLFGHFPDGRYRRRPGYLSGAELPGTR